MHYDIYINDTIGYPITESYVRQQLEAVPEGQPVEVYISSLGGDLATALQIRQMLAERTGVTAHLHGFVASAATIIACGAGKVVMGAHALYLVHRCNMWQEEWGQMNAEEIRQAIARLEANATALEGIDRLVASIYADKTGLALDAVHSLMEAELWMDAHEAVENGFVHAIEDDTPTEVTASLTARIAAHALPPVPEAEEPGDPGNPGEPSDPQLEALRTAYAQLQAERDELAARVEVLAAQDGDDTPAIEAADPAAAPSPAAEALVHVERARRAYNALFR